MAAAGSAQARLFFQVRNVFIGLTRPIYRYTLPLDRFAGGVVGAEAVRRLKL